MKSSLTISDIKTGPLTVPLRPKGVLICDIDGTLADLAHRLPHIETTPKDWASFFAKVGGDAPIFEIMIFVIELYLAGWQVIYCTGRREAEREATEAWFSRFNLPPGKLLMRPKKDFRPDVAVKSEMLQRLRSEGIAPTLVLEDRDRVVAMWREAGCTCVQVRDGAY